MREVTLILSILLSTSVAHAGALRDIIVNSGGDAVRILGVVAVIFSLGVMGFLGAAVLNMIEKQKFARLFERTCYIFAGILFVREALTAAGMFIEFIFG